MYFGFETGQATLWITRFEPQRRRPHQNAAKLLQNLNTPPETPPLRGSQVRMHHVGCWIVGAIRTVPVLPHVHADGTALWQDL
jgi:hypothetical protein